MTNEEALKALDELIVFNSTSSKENEHYFDTYEKILDKEMEKDKK